ncbi:MAG: glycosyltransferase [Nitrospira sp.]|nr:glycosyltransferase [Nitrospira sp.]MDH4302488.1 glycosyltransferase [Nitrospira sp.]MDH5192226.1 glycosyltransferase [Nitrospira sp.]
MRILQVNTADTGGGAETVAWQLMQGYRRAGHQSWMAVGKKNTESSDTYLIQHDPYRTAWSRWCGALANRLIQLEPSGKHNRRLYQLLALGLGQPSRAFQRWQGKEDFEFPGTAGLEGIPSELPDIVHCHNLHGSWLPDDGYFDLRALPGLSRRFPLVLTLHDAWMLSGHCAHSFDCERWRTGCGTCPDLMIYPSIKRDATTFNWRRKQDIFAKSKLFVATPSRWLMDKVSASMLNSGIVERRVIPNGVDLTLFMPAEQQAARADLGLPQHAKILLFAANGIRDNVWKDYRMLRNALSRMAAFMKGDPLLLLALGDEADTETVNSVTVQFIGYEQDPARVAKFYQAADLYVHAARVDTFPNTVIEAAACGTPVVATAVGGIPEQIDDGCSGLLVPAGDAESLAFHVGALLRDEGRRRAMSAEASRLAKDRFDLARQVQAYLEWYQEILMSSSPSNRSVPHAC